MNAVGIKKTLDNGVTENIFITYSGSELLGSYRYLMTRFDGNVYYDYAVLDNIQNGTPVLGRWTWASKALAYVCN